MAQPKCKIHLIAGARPNIIKVAPLYKLLLTQSWCAPEFVWFTQHYTPELSSENLQDFGIQKPDHVIEVSQDNFGTRLGGMITQYQSLCSENRPDFVIVAGDVDTSLGASLAARRLDIPLVHLEAGLRSYDAAMPEEANRILIDAISDVWLSPSEAALQNLVLHEGKPPERVHFVGNIMIDSLCQMLDRDIQEQMLADYAPDGQAFGVATFHRPANVDTPARATWILETLDAISRRHPIVFPLHPRTRTTFERLGLMERLMALPAVTVIPALRYEKFINLLARADFILTDSGGIQEEAAYLRKPCFTLRETTERPVTVHCGSNHLINPENTKDVIFTVLDTAVQDRQITRIPLWDGLTSQRISHVLNQWWIQRTRP
jgi:UDP-N-acetylglucosamine 2-epimerase (non-hydrolysing)